MSTESQSTHQAPARPSRPPLISIADFNPTQEQSERYLSLMADPDYNIGGAARVANTSIESFTLWLTRPEIAARLDNIESAISRKVRLDVAYHSSGIINACSTTINFYNEAMNHRFIAANDHRGHSIRVKEQSNALLASRILLHLAKHFAKPAQPPRAQRNPAALPQNPAPELDPDPAQSSPSSSSHFTILPPLPNLTNLHDQRAANHTTSPNPPRDNAFTSPSRKRRSDDPHAGDEAPRIPGCESQGPLNLAPTINTPTTPAYQPEDLTVNSRGLSESASATPGKQPIDSPHPVRVQPAAPARAPCACDSKSKHKPCAACASITPQVILTIAGTTTKRTTRRETPKPTA